MNEETGSMKEILDEYENEEWHVLIDLVTEHLPSQWRKMLLELKKPIQIKEVWYCGAYHAPAGRNNHHAHFGGWVSHVLEMWKVHTHMEEKIVIGGESSEYLSAARVLKGILLHDLHKTHLEFVPLMDERGVIKFEYSKHPFKKIQTPDQQSAYIAFKFDLQLDPLQLNALYNSEGGFAKDRPEYCSVLAKYLYILDELSSNVLNRIETNTLLNVREYASLQDILTTL
jgi:hypothetical protein